MILRKIKLTISEEDREKLNNVLKSSKSEYRMIERTRIITHLEKEPDVEKVAEKLNISSKSVRKWRKCFYLEGFEGLLERPRSDCPEKYILQDRMEITAIACDSPKNYGYETANIWTYEMLEEVSIREGINMKKTAIFETLKKRTSWDNLNIHKDGNDGRWREFNEKHNNKFVFHYTPIYSSWVNQIEIFFSILQKRCFRYGSYKSENELKEYILKFIDKWNFDEYHPFNWKFKGYSIQKGT